MRAVAAAVYDRRKYATLTERRYKNASARTSQTFHAIVQRKNFAEISPLALRRRGFPFSLAILSDRPPPQSRGRQAGGYRKSVERRLV